MISHVGEPVHLILDGGRPARFYWHERWTITQATADAFDWLGDDSRVASWHVAAQTEDLSDAAEFELTRDYAAGGWLIDSVTYA
ncbi:hypothetical protein GCM10022286_00890 [Gryllotalpicola daejeonensis]|uniref:Uncharacterized protein n=1 Tax=Gryllotalpicola daejeonensis TaxID=993087 RepID=A0ABP7ZCZ4_9MICO